VLEGAASVEVTRIREEDWDAFGSGFPLRIGFRDSRDKKVDRFRMGDRKSSSSTCPKAIRQATSHMCVCPPACLGFKEEEK